MGAAKERCTEGTQGVPLQGFINLQPALSETAPRYTLWSLDAAPCPVHHIFAIPTLFPMESCP